jgi:galactokinase
MAMPTMNPITNLRQEFRKRFGEEARVFRAPGRVNLIGEHTDYNDGFVMPAAIDFYTTVAIAPRADSRLVAESLQFPERLEADLHDRKHRRTGAWHDYCWGVAQSLRESGFQGPGANLLVNGEVPIGSGLSSSAAIEIATGFALLETWGMKTGLVQLAKICQRAENEFVGARCGIMDQFISATGREGNAVLLDCRSLEYSYSAMPAGVELVICNTMVKHSIAGGEYNQRRAECEQGVLELRKHLPGVHALRDVSIDDFRKHEGSLSPVVRRRCRHVITENGRVLDAADALAAGDLAHVGKLMHESHVSLRDDYEVSCKELDIMVDLALAQRGLVGARMTGGGFGGCTVNLVRAEAIAEFRKNVAAEYEKRTKLKPDIYVSVASGGVHEAS